MSQIDDAYDDPRPRSPEDPWLCATCAVEYPPSDEPPAACPICEDERQYVPPGGQRWTTLGTLTAAGQRGRVALLEPGLHAVTTDPEVGIGQQSVLVQTAGGNLLWDPTSYVDDELVAAVHALGGVSVVAASHPHLFGVQVEWARRFPGAVVLVNEADLEWVQRPDEVIRPWTDRSDVLPGVSLHRIGGHFPGSAVARVDGSDGRGVLLTGDTVSCIPDEGWVSFLRSYPNRIPLSAATVRAIADRLAALDFDRVYDAFDGRVPAGAGPSVQRSADRYIAWVSGSNDHLTGTVES